MKISRRHLYLASIAALSLLTSLLSAAAAEMPRPFFEQHCTDCHDAMEKKGGLDLNALKTNFADAENFALWVKVQDRVAAGEMPPKKKERPPAEEKAAFLGTLANELTLAEASKSAGGGRSTVRRINHAEYNDTIRDLRSIRNLWLPVSAGFRQHDGAVHVELSLMRAAGGEGGGTGELLEAFHE